MNEKTKGLISVFVVALDAAPGATYWSLVQNLANGPSGLSQEELSSLIVGSPQFKSLYPPPAIKPDASAGADSVFSDALITRVLGNASLSPEARAGALLAGESIMAEAKKAGQGDDARRATLITSLSEYLSAIKTDPGQTGYDAAQPYLAVAKQLSSKVAVADFYTNVLKREETDILALREALSRVSDKSAVLNADGVLNVTVAETLIRGFDADTQHQLYRAFVVALDAAPGGYWGVLEDLVELEGLGPVPIVGLITTSPQFRAMYPAGGESTGAAAADKIFSDALINRLVGDATISADARADALAAGDLIMAEARKAGQGEDGRRAALVTALSNYLGTIETDAKQSDYDPKQPYLSVAIRLANKVSVAEYYTETFKASETEIGMLRQVLSRTTAQSDVSTDAARARLADFAAPFVVSFTSTTPDGSYKAGQSINITAVANEPLREGSQISVTLETGETDHPVLLKRDSADPKKLVGSYLVQAGDASDDLNVKSYALGTGAEAPADLAGNLMVASVLPTASDSLAGSKALVINTSDRVNTAITGSGSFNALTSDVTFRLPAITSSYTYTIAGFGAGDRIVGPAGETATLADQSSFTDGSLSVQYAKGGNVVKVTLTGLTAAQDASIFSVADLNTVFGAESFGAAGDTVPIVPGPVTSSPSGRVNLTITGSGSFNALTSDVTFSLPAITSSYTYTIAGFGAGDRIVGPAGETATLADQSSFTDGSLSVQYAKGGNVVKVTLTGLTAAQDASIFSVADLNTVFGAGSFV